MFPIILPSAEMTLLLAIFKMTTCSLVSRLYCTYAGVQYEIHVLQFLCGVVASAACVSADLRQL